MNHKYDHALLKLSTAETELKTLSQDQEQKDELTKMLRTQIDVLSGENLGHKSELEELQRQNSYVIRDLGARIRCVRRIGKSLS